MNTIKCCDCAFFDPIAPPKGRIGSHARCAARSVYPQEAPGQRYPAGVKRAAPGAMPKMEIVRVDELVPQCVFASKKKG